MMGIGQWGALQAVAPTLALELSVIDVRNTDESDRGLVELNGKFKMRATETTFAPVSLACIIMSYREALNTLKQP